MSFSRAQQGCFRPLVERAWQATCQCDEADPQDRAAREAWYRGELRAATGKDSTADCNKARNFDRAMAHFEAVARDDALWALRTIQGDFRRLEWLCREAQIDEAYARATSARVLKWPGHLASLDEIKHLDDLQKVRIALIKHARRKAAPRRTPSPPPVDADNIPF